MKIAEWWHRRRCGLEHRYQGSTCDQERQWAKEDLAFALLARDTLDAAAVGADLGPVLQSCPDLTKLALDRLR